MTASLVDIMSDPKKIAGYYRKILKEICMNVDSEGMKETPLRAAKALEEIREEHGWKRASLRRCPRPNAKRRSTKAR
jgi:GTP cyclohydrolase I